MADRVLPKQCYCTKFTPRRKKDGQKHYHCPLCSYTGTADRIRRHLPTHDEKLVKDTVILGEILVISCSCRSLDKRIKIRRSHFHCPYCGHAHLKYNLEKHARNCKGRWIQRDGCTIKGEPVNEMDQQENYDNDSDGLIETFQSAPNVSRMTFQGNDLGQIRDTKNSNESENEGNESDLNMATSSENEEDTEDGERIHPERNERDSTAIGNDAGEEEELRSGLEQEAIKDNNTGEREEVECSSELEKVTQNDTEEVKEVESGPEKGMMMEDDTQDEEEEESESKGETPMQNNDGEEEEAEKDAELQAMMNINSEMGEKDGSEPDKETAMENDDGDGEDEATESEQETSMEHDNGEDKEIESGSETMLENNARDRKKERCKSKKKRMLENDTEEENEEECNSELETTIDTAKYEKSDRYDGSSDTGSGFDNLFKIGPGREIIQFGCARKVRNMFKGCTFHTYKDGLIAGKENTNLDSENRNEAARKKTHSSPSTKHIASTAKQKNTSDSTYKILPNSVVIDNINKSHWETILRNIRVNKSGRRRLPLLWTKHMAEELRKLEGFYCTLSFSNHHVISEKGPEIFKCWFKCKHSGCIEGTAIFEIDGEFFIKVDFTKTSIIHKGFKARNLTGDDRRKLASTIPANTRPSKRWHQLLAGVNNDQFEAGNLDGIPISKNVVRQVRSEHRRAGRADNDLVESIRIIKNKYMETFPDKTKKVMGFIQIQSFNPLTIALWVRKDVELYQTMAKSFPLVVDATAGVVTKVNLKEIFYYAMVFHDKNVKIEPVPVFELLTDCPDEDMFTFCLGRFLNAVKSAKNRDPYVPLLAVCDFSWVIIKSLITCFNHEKLNKYVDRCHTILSGMARVEDLPSDDHHYLVVHICLAHVMKFVSFRAGKRFPKREDKSFILFCVSCIVNTKNLKEFRETLNDFLVILLSSTSTNEVYIESMRNMEERINQLGSSDNFTEKKDDESDPLEEEDDPKDPERPIAKVKRSKFYNVCKEIFDRISRLSELKKGGKSSQKNQYKNIEFAKYIMNHLCGMAPLWTKMMIGDLGRHGSSSVYADWSSAFKNVQCINNPTDTQGIIEKHNDSLKNVYLTHKDGRLDEVVDDLSLAKLSSHRQRDIAVSEAGEKAKKRIEKNEKASPKKVQVEKFRKRKSSAGPGKYQQPRARIEREVSKNPLPSSWTFSELMEWGGEVQLDEDWTTEIVNTCSLDNFLIILWAWYKENPHFLTRHLQNTGSALLDTLEGIVSLMLTENYSEARLKLICMRQNLDPNSELICVYNTDFTYSMEPFMPLYRRSCTTSCKNNQNCQTKDGKRLLTSMTLQMPSKFNENMIEVAISNCINGESQPTLCNHVFDDDSCIDDLSCVRPLTVDNMPRLACNGVETFSQISFESSQPPPMLQFDIAVDFVSSINNIKQIPKTITVLDNDYVLGGCIAATGRRHFVGFIYHQPTDSYYYYDDKHIEQFGKITNLFLKSLRVTMICFFRLHDFSTSPVTTHTENIKNPRISKNNKNRSIDTYPSSQSYNLRSQLINKLASTRVANLKKENQVTDKEESSSDEENDEKDSTTEEVRRSIKDQDTDEEMEDDNSELERERKKKLTAAMKRANTLIRSLKEKARNQEETEEDEDNMNEENESTDEESDQETDDDDDTNALEENKSADDEAEKESEEDHDENSNEENESADEEADKESEEDEDEDSNEENESADEKADKESDGDEDEDSNEENESADEKADKESEEDKDEDSNEENEYADEEIDHDIEDNEDGNSSEEEIEDENVENDDEDLGAEKKVNVEVDEGNENDGGNDVDEKVNVECEQGVIEDANTKNESEPLSFIISIPLEKLKKRTVTAETGSTDTHTYNIDHLTSKKDQFNGSDRFLVKSPFTKGITMKSRRCQDDSYTQMLDHHQRCKTSSVQLADYRELDQNRSDKAVYLRRLRNFIKHNSTIPGSVTLAIDDETKKAVIWDGNHRLSCVDKMKDDFPGFIKVKFVRMNLEHVEKGVKGDLLKIPTLPDTWPSFPCGCNFGLDTSEQ